MSEKIGNIKQIIGAVVDVNSRVNCRKSILP